jgi:predicted transposase/invertase (TIGR01784 family)
VYYSTFPIQQQAQKGDWHFKLKAVYTIGILDFVFDEDKEDNEVFHHEVKMVDIKTGKVFYDKLTYIYLEMPKFQKTEAARETHFDKWLYILKNLTELTNPPKKLSEKVFQQLFAQAEIAQFNEQEHQQYEQSLKIYRDLKNVIDTARDEGRAEGIQEGIKKGIEKGMEKGILTEKKNMVINSHQLGLDHKTIHQLTGLSIKEIKKILIQTKPKKG